jgi:hypothetical protein
MSIAISPKSLDVSDESPGELPPMDQPMRCEWAPFGGRLIRKEPMGVRIVRAGGPAIPTQPWELAPGSEPGVDVERGALLPEQASDEELRQRLGYAPPERMRARAIAFIRRRDLFRRQMEQMQIEFVRQLASKLADLQRPVW